jgi:hypothetical protein
VISIHAPHKGSGLVLGWVPAASRKESPDEPLKPAPLRMNLLPYENGLRKQSFCYKMNSAGKPHEINLFAGRAETPACGARFLTILGNGEK